MIAAPAFIVTVVARLPLPAAAPQAVVTMPPLPALVTAQVHAPKLRPAGAASVTVASVTSPGPLLATTMVYVVVPPGVTLVTPSVLVIARSALTGAPITVSASLAALLAGTGSAVAELTVAVLVITVPPATAMPTLTVRLNAALPPAARVAMVQVTVPPAPTAGVTHDQPGAAVSDTKVVPAGSVSARVAPVAASGPALATTMA